MESPCPVATFLLLLRVIWEVHAWLLQVPPCYLILVCLGVLVTYLLTVTEYLTKPTSGRKGLVGLTVHHDGKVTAAEACDSYLKFIPSQEAEGDECRCLATFFNLGGCPNPAHGIRLLTLFHPA